MNFLKTLVAIEAVIIVSLLGYIYLTQNQAPLVKVDTQVMVQPKAQPNQAIPSAGSKPVKPDEFDIQPSNPQVKAETSEQPVQPPKESFTSLFNDVLKAQGRENIDYLLVTKGEELFELIRNNPELANTIIEKYNELSDPRVEEFLAQLIVMSGVENIEDKMMQKIANGNPTESRKWLRILSYAGASNTNNRQMVLQQMRSLDAQGINLAIKSLTPINAYASERKTITNELKTYLQHNDENVRAQALKALGQWAGEERQQIIEKGLSDSSDKIRSSAILTAYESGIKSDRIKQRLFKIMNDESQKVEDRLIASSALEEYNLSDTERDNHTLFTKRAESLFEQQMQEQE